MLSSDFRVLSEHGSLKSDREGLCADLGVPRWRDENERGGIAICKCVMRYSCVGERI